MKYLFILLFFLLLGCGSTSEYGKSNFDQEVWLANPKMEDQYNPRARMTDDLLNNWLKPGITRDSIISLLGEPYSETISRRLPKGMSTPDSIAPHKYVGQPRGLQDSILAAYNAWHQANGQLDTLMLYPVGWSMIDPNFLAVKLSPDSIAYEFWVEQH